MSLPRPLPLGNSSFSRIKVAGQIYVDKTRLIFDLSSKKEKFLLTRPRRFGKSLLISTFESLFKLGLRDFRGLEADIGSWSLNARKEQRMSQRSWKKQFLN
ncbi:AAA family ATPase [Turicimonas muris]|uniref:AAA family ATPase n=1 Tax=Turicimonas muris TaxID=1796652 RepID=UPI0024944BFF|nr:AAA family ATPase [Turicimonas muris]